MKFSKAFALIALMAVGFSCSDDDKDPEPNIEDAALSFAESSEVLEVPEGLLSNDDPNAQIAAGWIQMANGLSANLAMFTPPANAERSTDLITPVNGRVASITGVRYTWENPNYGSVAYQITDVSDKYSFEVFYKGVDDSGWYRSVYAEEMKDRSSGFLVVYDALGSVSETRDAQLARFDWSRVKENFIFKMTGFENEFNFTLTVNTTTKAGTAVYFVSNAKAYEMTWDALGSGTWKHFDETGAVTDEGTWTHA